MKCYVQSQYSRDRPPMEMMVLPFTLMDLREKKVSFKYSF